MVASLALSAAAEGGSGGLTDIDSGLFIWTLVMFVVFAGILAKFAWGPLLKIIDEREQGLRDAVQDARKSNEEAASLLEEHRAMLRDAGKDREEILKTAQADADRPTTDTRSDVDPVESGIRFGSPRHDGIRRNRDISKRHLARAARAEAECGHRLPLDSIRGYETQRGLILRPLGRDHELIGFGPGRHHRRRSVQHVCRQTGVHRQLGRDLCSDRIRHPDRPRQQLARNHSRLHPIQRDADGRQVEG